MPGCPHPDDPEHAHLREPATLRHLSQKSSNLERIALLHLAAKVYDVIVVGTGAGGGTAMKILCEAGLRSAPSTRVRAPTPRRTIAGTGKFTI